MDVTIYLEPLGYSVRASREGLLKMRGSLFAQALETEPEAREINLPNPLVKPQHLDAIVVMARQEIPKMCFDENIDAVADYLNWPLLKAVTVGLIPRMLEFAPYVDIFRPETYGSVLLWAIMEECGELVKHILQMTETTPLDAQAFVLAAMSHQPGLVKMLLPRVNPVTSSMSLRTLQIWTYPTDLRQPNNPLINDAIAEFLEGKDNQAFRQAVIRMVPISIYNDSARQTLSLLLADERVKATAPLKEALELAVKTESRVLLLYLLTKTEVGPNFEVKGGLSLIQAAVQWECLESVSILAECPRVNISAEMRGEVRLASSLGRPDFLRNLNQLFELI